MFENLSNNIILSRPTCISVSTSSRFCPFCGQSNDYAYSFCARCGKPLPEFDPPSPTKDGVALPPPPPDSPAPSDPFETVIERSLTEEEKGVLKRAQRSPAVGVPKILATIFGIAPLFLVFIAFMGAPLDATMYPFMMIGCAVTAIVMGAICYGLRYPAGFAIAKGTVQEARGVPRKVNDANGEVKVRLGGVELASAPAVTESMQEGRLNSLVYIPPNTGGQGQAGRPRGWVIGLNGVTFPRPVTCSIIPIPEVHELVPTVPPPPPPPEMLVIGGK